MNRPETPLLTVDILIRMVDQPAHPIVLIERKHPPFGWALPGGFVDVGERLEDAAVREAKEETSLDIELETLLGCYSDPARDDRGHTVSAVYLATARGEPRAQDDAKHLACYAPQACPELVFDHELIISDYLHYLQTEQVAPLRLTWGNSD